MTPIAWVVEQSLQASERFRHLTVMPCFECGGKMHCYTDSGKYLAPCWECNEAEYERVRND